jgi:hypothetical protein
MRDTVIESKDNAIPTKSQLTKIMKGNNLKVDNMRVSQFVGVY